MITLKPNKKYHVHPRFSNYSNHIVQYIGIDNKKDTTKYQVVPLEPGFYDKYNVHWFIEPRHQTEFPIHFGKEIEDFSFLFIAELRDLPEEIIAFAKKYDVIVERQIDDYGINCGAYSGPNLIWLSSTFDDPEEELAAFFHELGHIELGRLANKISHHMCIVSSEGAAWEIGFAIAAKEGYKWNYHSKAYQYGRRCLKSYIGGEYDDLKDIKE